MILNRLGALILTYFYNSRVQESRIKNISCINTFDASCVQSPVTIKKKDFIERFMLCVISQDFFEGRVMRLPDGMLCGEPNILAYLNAKNGQARCLVNDKMFKKEDMVAHYLMGKLCERVNSLNDDFEIKDIFDLLTCQLTNTLLQDPILLQDGRTVNFNVKIHFNDNTWMHDYRIREILNYVFDTLKAVHLIKNTSFEYVKFCKIAREAAMLLACIAMSVGISAVLRQMWLAIILPWISDFRTRERLVKKIAQIGIPDRMAIFGVYAVFEVYAILILLSILESMQSQLEKRLTYFKKRYPTILQLVLYFQLSSLAYLVVQEMRLPGAVITSVDVGILVVGYLAAAGSVTLSSY